MGQHIANSPQSFPKEFCNKLKLLEDRAAYRPYWQIERALKRQYRPRRPSDIFSHIDEKPVAAASLAQVHKATLRDTGQEVAIKVQYPGLETLVQGDLMSIRLLSWMLNWFFPFFSAEWLVHQFQGNLQQEVDFKHEAESCRRTGSSFESNPHISVPRVHDAISTQRILVMDFINGWRIDDVDSIRGAGIDTKEVAQAVVDAFAQMIFINGNVHCDPHTGNFLVSAKGKKGDFEVFLLDHGLYKEMDDDFRHAYCRLWKGLVLRRFDDVKQACDDLGASGLENVFALMLLNRSWKSVSKMGTDLRTKMSPEEIQDLKKDLRESGLKSQADFTSFVEKIPEELWLVFKMNALVRNVNKGLGASVNRFKLNVRHAIRGLSVFNDEGDMRSGQHEEGSSFTVASGNEHSHGWGLGSSLTYVYRWFWSNVFDVLLVESKLLMFDAVRLSFLWWRMLLGKKDAPLIAAGVEELNDSFIG